MCVLETNKRLLSSRCLTRVNGVGMENDTFDRCVDKLMHTEWIIYLVRMIILWTQNWFKEKPFSFGEDIVYICRVVCQSLLSMKTWSIAKHTTKNQTIHWTTTCCKRSKSVWHRVSVIQQARVNTFPVVCIMPSLAMYSHNSTYGPVFPDLFRRTNTAREPNALQAPSGAKSTNWNELSNLNFTTRLTRTLYAPQSLHLRWHRTTSDEWFAHWWQFAPTDNGSRKETVVVRASIRILCFRLPWSMGRKVGGMCSS